jgi:hypothetical protein
VHHLVTEIEKTYNLAKREELYSTITKFGTPIKLVRLIKLRLNDAYSKVNISKSLSDAFPTPNGPKQGDALSSLLLSFTLQYAIRKVQENQE